MKLITPIDLRQNKKYLVIYDEFGYREYVSIFYGYDITFRLHFTVVDSYDFQTGRQPHVGRRSWDPDSIFIYEMVPQAQASMEARALSMILKRLLGEDFFW
jgi:hypothetical protein